LEAPGITRRRRPRRPFLAPLWVIILLVLMAAGLVLLILHFAGTTVVVVVHPPGGDDRPLSVEGQERAQNLALLFGEPRGAAGRLDAVYAADIESARQTLAPLASRLGQQPVAVPAANPSRAVARMLRQHSGGTMLLVVRSDQLPDLVRELSGARVPPAADDTGYILSIPTIGEASLLRFRY
jgi:hypothetical protein